MDISKIDKEIDKINVRLSMKKDDKHMKAVFTKAEKNVKQLLKQVNKLDQKDPHIIEAKNELTRQKWYIYNTIKAYFTPPKCSIRKGPCNRHLVRQTCTSKNKCKYFAGCAPTTRENYLEIIRKTMGKVAMEYYEKPQRCDVILFKK